MKFPYLTGEVGNIGISKIKNRVVGGPIVYDTFTDADGATLLTHVISPVNLTGNTYFFRSFSAFNPGNFVITSNTVHVTTTYQYATIDCGTPSVRLVLDFVAGSYNITFVLRASKTQDRYFFVQRDGNSNTWNFYEVNPGFVIRASGVYAVVNGTTYTAQFIASGDSYTFLINDTQVLNYAGVSSLSANVLHGMGGYGAQAKDNLYIYAL